MQAQTASAESTSAQVRADPNLSADAIMQLGMAYGASKALLSAVELGVFTELAREPLDGPGLAARLGIHSRGAQDFFDTLVALRLLQRTHGYYSNGLEADAFLDRAKSAYIGGILELANARLYSHWGRLTDALREGRPQNEAPHATDPYAEIYSDPARLENFLRAMTAVSLNAANVIAEKFPWGEYRSFIDVGAAQGVLAVRVAAMHPHLTGGGFDLPAVRPIFEKYVAGQGLSERLQFFGGDFFRDPLPAADVVVLGHVLHNWNLEQKKFLLKQAYDALTDEGALIVYEALIDDERRHNLAGLLFSLTMLLETPGGFDFTGAECMTWMQQAGFRETNVEHLVGPEFMVVGIK